MTDLTWHDGLPCETGYYWIRFPLNEFVPPQIMTFYKEHPGTMLYSYPLGTLIEWAGPIPPPPEDVK